MRILLPALLSAFLLSAQIPRIGAVDYYGLHKVSEERVRKAAGVSEGDHLPASKTVIEDRLEQIPGIVLAHLEAVCCVGDRAILYVGVEERGTPHLEFHEAPQGESTLPKTVTDEYDGFLLALAAAARAGHTGQDLSSGYELSSDPGVRAYQERFLRLALANLTTLREVLRNSMYEDQRAIAAYVIGYAPPQQGVIDDLQNALQDPAEGVRANAMRSLAALTVLAEAKPGLGLHVPATWFVELLHSMVWSDRYHGAQALVAITDGGNPAALEQIRQRGLTSVVEMARWKTLTHALPAFILTGRVAGLPDKEIHEAWNRGDREPVLKRALKAAERK